MAKAIRKNINNILYLEDYDLVIEVCNKIAETDELTAGLALQFWETHNPDKVSLIA